jgi:uncharacterized surface protein with fasciclin (FAS1) repeats
MRMLTRLAAALTVVALVSSGCKEKEVRAERPEPVELTDIYTTLVRTERYETLVTAIEKAGLAETLKGPGPFTLFAPDNEAFAQLPRGRLDYLMEHPEELKKLLLHHVAPAKILASEVTWSLTIRTIGGDKLKVTVKRGVERVDGAAVLVRDMMATNGVIHIVDTVLEPPRE